MDKAAATARPALGCRELLANELDPMDIVRD